MASYFCVYFDPDNGNYGVNSFAEIPEIGVKKMDESFRLIFTRKVSDAIGAARNFSSFASSKGVQFVNGRYQFSNAFDVREVFIHAVKGIETNEPIEPATVTATRLSSFAADKSIAMVASEFSFNYQKAKGVLMSDCVVVDGEVYRKVAPSRSGSDTGQGRPAKYPWPSMAVGESVDFGGFREYTRAERAARAYGKRNDIGFEFSADNMTVTRVK